MEFAQALAFRVLGRVGLGFELAALGLLAGNILADEDIGGCVRQALGLTWVGQRDGDTEELRIAHPLGG